MEDHKTDRRVRYTKRVLKESFINLLEQKDISQITIKEICEHADINRATFYAHYSDQYDLMRKIEDELLDNVDSYLGEYARNAANPDMVKIVKKIFDYIKENAKICRLLLSDRGDLNFQKKIMMLVYDKNVVPLANDGLFSKEEAEYTYSFIVTGCVGVIQKWLDSGMKQPAQFMAEFLVKLNCNLSVAARQK